MTPDIDRIVEEAREREAGCFDPEDAEYCHHGVAFDEECEDCELENEEEAFADREIAYQRDVIEPLCGFGREDEDGSQ